MTGNSRFIDTQISRVIPAGSTILESDYLKSQIERLTDSDLRVHATTLWSRGKYDELKAILASQGIL